MYMEKNVRQFVSYQDLNVASLVVVTVAGTEKEKIYVKGHL